MIVSPVFLNAIVVLIRAKRYLYSGINMAVSYESHSRSLRFLFCV